MSRALGLLTLGLIVGLALLAYFLTLDPSQQDPCLSIQNDLSAAILSDDADRDALANRAIVQRKACEAKLKARATQ